MPDPHEYHKLREKHLGITSAVSKLLSDIYYSEYRNKFGERVGLSVSETPLLITYLRVSYAFPNKTESELIELYREAIKAGIVRATIDGEHWKWNPEDDKPALGQTISR